MDAYEKVPCNFMYVQGSAFHVPSSSFTRGSAYVNNSLNALKEKMTSNSFFSTNNNDFENGQN